MSILCLPNVQARGYTSVGRCGAYPRVSVASPPGTCVALVADEAQGLSYPRRVLEVAPGRLWVLDMGASWVPKKGKLIEILLPADERSVPRRVEAKVLLTGLNLPSGLARGADGLIYVGEADTIWRTPVPPSGQSPRPEVLLKNLPSDGAHPLKEIAAAPDGSFYVNMGSATDACHDAEGRLPMPCPERSGQPERAAVWRLTVYPWGHPSPVQAFVPFAHGLRNSMALAVMPDGPAAGSVWQGENGIDYPEVDRPPEELNRLEAGKDYGWPYCHGQRLPTRGYENRSDCARTQMPHLLWPAHAAPLHMLATSVNSPFRGQLLVAWHGQRGSGSRRVVGFSRNARGLPSGPPIEWLGSWTEDSGRRPAGRPTGLALDHAGRLLVVEDYNRSLLMLQPMPARGR